MERTEREWIEVVVECPVTLTELVASELVDSVEQAQSGVQVRKSEVVFWVHPPDLETTLGQVRACMRALAERGCQVDPAAVRSGVMAPEEEWRDAWKKHFHVTRLTRQIIVVPSWEDYSEEPDDIVIHLDPGQAFGTGAHASTQLVLEQMQSLSDSGYAADTAFDLGTGSGILAIAAAKFWPALHITATDIDPLSITATRENTEQNAVSDRVAVSTTALDEVQGQFALILANIQAHILHDLQEGILARLQPGGRLLVSGILTSQIQALVDAYCEQDGLSLVGIQRSELQPDWSCAHLLRAET